VLAQTVRAAEPFDAMSRAHGYRSTARKSSASRAPAAGRRWPGASSRRTFGGLFRAVPPI